MTSTIAPDFDGGPPLSVVLTCPGGEGDTRRGTLGCLRRDTLASPGEQSPFDHRWGEQVQAGDLLVSHWSSHLVFVVDPDSERVKYAPEPFVMHDDPAVLGDGWIGVFDNNRDHTGRGERFGGTRILGLQPHTDSMRVMFPRAESMLFYTGTRGKWPRLENGNLLLTESNAGRVVGVSPDGRTVWEWVFKPDDESSRPAVTKGTRYPLTVGEVDDWPCLPSHSSEHEEASSS